MLKLSFVIVEYYSVEDILDCYSSIKSCELSTMCTEVIVSSNSDYTLKKQQELRTKYSQLRWLFNEKNGGFAYAMNRGLKECVGDVLIVMNPDVRLKYGIDGMVSYLHNQKNVGLIAPMICNKRNEIQDSFRSFITPLNFLERHLRRLAGLGEFPPSSSPIVVDWVCGAFMMMSRASYRVVDGLDEGYFLYCEDMDLCKRMYLHGYNVVYYPLALVEYEGTRSARKSLKYACVFLKSLFKYWGKFGLHN